MPTVCASTGKEANYQMTIVRLWIELDSNLPLDSLQTTLG